MRQSDIFTKNGKVLRVEDAGANPNTYVITRSGSAGAAAQVIGSSDTLANVDLLLSGTGTGDVSFGTYTGGTVAQAGYITVKDAGGTIRRLLVG